jgi:hypothetical protein
VDGAWRSDHDHDRGESDEAEDVSGGFFVAGGEPAALLEPAGSPSASAASFRSPPVTTTFNWRK